MQLTHDIIKIFPHFLLLMSYSNKKWLLRFTEKNAFEYIGHAYIQYVWHDAHNISKSIATLPFQNYMEWEKK